MKIGCRQQRWPGFAQAVGAVLAVPDTRKRLVDQGFQPDVMPAEKLAASISAERAKWAKVVKAIGIEPQ